MFEVILFLLSFMTTHKYKTKSKQLQYLRTISCRRPHTQMKQKRRRHTSESQALLFTFIMIIAIRRH